MILFLIFQRERDVSQVELWKLVTHTQTRYYTSRIIVNINTYIQILETLLHNILPQKPLIRANLSKHNQPSNQETTKPPSNQKKTANSRQPKQNKINIVIEKQPNHQAIRRKPLIQANLSKTRSTQQEIQKNNLASQELQQQQREESVNESTSNRTRRKIPNFFGGLGMF